MRKFIFISLIFLLIISCNASILMTNGEVTEPGGNGSSSSSSTRFSTAAPRSVNATKSYYTDSIVVRWSAVEGADYYTVEKTSHKESEAPDNAIWNMLPETIENGTSYIDKQDLERNMYYSYRITAHTYEGKTGKTSSVSTGTILSSPINLDASKGESPTSITVKWEQMPNVESYKIYKSTIESISGLEGEYVNTINASDKSVENFYSYDVNESEKGAELYFAIKGVGPTGEEAQISGSRYGYTLVQGAPVTPEVIASKGNSTDSVTVKFRANNDDGNYKYIIKRSNPGSTERNIFNNLEEGSSDVLPQKDEFGFYIIEDGDVRQNIEYTYSVIAINDIGMSKAGVATGYLLSPVENLALVADKENMGYKLSFDLPVGADDKDRSVSYEYEIVKEFKNKTTENETVAESDIGSYINKFFKVGAMPTKETELTEIKSVSITVKNSDGKQSSTSNSNIISMLSDPIDSISATSFDKPLQSDVANSKGVYPVHVKWTTQSTKEQTLTRVGSDGTSVTFTVNNGFFDDASTEPLVIYDYYIDTSDELGRTLGGEVKHAKNSYAAITPEVFVDMFESLSLKPWEKQGYVPKDYRSYWKNSKIARLVGYGNASDLGTQMKALDTAEDKDHYHSDSKITYSAAMEGVGGQIYFTYKNFGESQNFYTTGNYEMHVNASGTGSASSNTGGFQVSGMYPGHVKLDKISVSGKAFKGAYVFSIEYRNSVSENYEVAVK